MRLFLTESRNSVLGGNPKNLLLSRNLSDAQYGNRAKIALWGDVYCLARPEKYLT